MKKHIFRAKAVVVVLFAILCISTVYTVQTKPIAAEAATSAPGGVSVVAENGSAIITWNAVNGAKTYALFMKDASGNVALVHNRISGTSYTLSGLKDGGRYGFVLKAYTNAGWSGYSATTWVTCNVVVKAPATVTATPGDGEVTVSWTPTYAAQTYALFMKDTAGNVTLVHNRINGTSYTVKGMKNGVRMGFVVKAYANRQWSSWSKVAWTTPKEIKNVPTNLQATTGYKKITITWDEIEHAEKYAVYLKNKNGAITLLSSEVKENCFIITGLTTDETVGLVVKAFVDGMWWDYSGVVWGKARITKSDMISYIEREDIVCYDKEMPSDNIEKIYNDVVESAMKGYPSTGAQVIMTKDEVIELAERLLEVPGITWVNIEEVNGFANKSRYNLMHNDWASVVYAYLTGDETVIKEGTIHEELLEATKKVMKKVNGLSTEYAKEKYIHDYLVETVQYDLDVLFRGTAYSALVLNKSVCAGYADAFQLLLSMAGIDCLYVSGEADNGEERAGHAWNKVKINDEWYNVDVTWDDAGYIRYTYFNVTDEFLSQNHFWDNTGLPVCTATKIK